jgi:hypothetical protein
MYMNEHGREGLVTLSKSEKRGSLGDVHIVF